MWPDTMRHTCETCELINSAVFANIVGPSQCHRDIIRWLHNVIAMASRSRVAFLTPSVSFVFPSYCLQEAKMQKSAFILFI